MRTKTRNPAGADNCVNKVKWLISRHIIKRLYIYIAIVVKPFQSPLNWTCSSYCLHTVNNTYVYTTSTVNGASLTYGLHVFLHFFVWVAHHLQSPLSISSMSSLPFRRVSHDGRPFESQWVEGLKREPVLCRHLSSVPSIALARISRLP